MEYFDNYDEQLDKKLTTPDTLLIPERYYEPEVVDNHRLTTEELIAKQKRLQDLKKVLAVQSLQDFNLSEINKQADTSLQAQNKHHQSYYNSFNSDNDLNDLHLKYEQEKQSREQVSLFFFSFTLC